VCTTALCVIRRSKHVCKHESHSVHITFIPLHFMTIIVISCVVPLFSTKSNVLSMNTFWNALKCKQNGVFTGTTVEVNGPVIIIRWEVGCTKMRK